MKKILMVLMFLSFVVACGGSSSGDGGDSSGAALANMAIENATDLVIASSSSSGTTNSSSSGEITNKLFKVTEDGFLLEVTYQDEGGNSWTTVLTPCTVCSVSNEYVIVQFSNTSSNCELSPKAGYLVRKSDGAVFSLENSGYVYPQENSFLNAPVAHVDSGGNIYYLIRALNTPGHYTDQTVVKLNVSNPNSITSSAISPSTDSPQMFDVTQGGDLFYYGTILDSRGGISRIVSAGGSLANFTCSDSACNDFWIGYDGNVYILDIIGFNTLIKSVSSAGDYTNYGELALGDGLFDAFSSYYFSFSNRTLIVSIGQDSIFEVNNPDHSPRKVTLPTLKSISTAAASLTYYYLAGTDENDDPVLLRVNPGNDASEQMFTAGAYDIYKMAVSDSDGITFNALRMSDGAKIIGKIDADKNLTIVDATLNQEVNTLVRIR